ncbi:MAG: LemA family protein [Fimbriimonadaceae bacterium]|nr:LemA family protein [Chitinophagales bacterium]
MADTTPTTTGRKGGIPRWAITLGVLAIIGIILYNFFAGSYNKMVKMDEEVNKTWANVQTQYQRRADLIPNLVETVKGYANFEQETLTEIAKLRAQAGQSKIDVGNAQNPAEIEAAMGGANSALSRLLVIVENYPDLKANQNFLELQAEIAGTENRIQVARMDFNNSIQPYNTYIRSFPRNLIAGMYGFSKRDQFEAQAGADTTPTVDFNTGDK